MRGPVDLAISRHYLPEGGNPANNVPVAKVGRKRVPYCTKTEFEAIFA